MRSLCIALAIWGAVNIVIALSFAFLRWRWRRRGCRNNEGLVESAIPYTVGEGRDAILFIHGFNDVPYVWRRMAERMSESGFACRAMRLPGAGDLEGRARLNLLLRSVRDEFASLSERHRRVFVIAHSMGAALVLKLIGDGSLEQRKLGGVVLLAPLVEVSRARSPLLTPRAYYLILRILLPVVRCLPSVFKDRIVSEDDPMFGYSRDRFIHISWYEALFALVAMNRRLPVNQSHIPMLVYAAGEDRVVDSDATEAFFSQRGTSVCKVIGASHPLPLTKAWRSVTDEICEWIRRRPPDLRDSGLPDREAT